MYAQGTVFANIQFGFPQNVSTRSEVTRWFGVSILYTLYMADILTSGTDNDFGLGIIPFRDAWFCDKTLRVTPGYSSLKFLDLFLMLLMEILIIIFSYVLVPMLKLYANTLKKRETESIQDIRDSLASLAQHNLLQQHRIAVEHTTDQRFRGTLDTIPSYPGQNSGRAPAYVVRTRQSITLTKNAEDLEMNVIESCDRRNRETSETVNDEELSELSDGADEPASADVQGPHLEAIMQARLGELHRRFYDERDVR